ncbi:DUF968 domain-containing protein [Salmonella enterica subsp. diarizonae]|uniref:DUF968 domain-containing protein n=1 Tax=Salmonella enterica TaxID=28901 RepID=UPI000FB2F2A8|nr:DUF968 domain-containing protein [Salmonella enterica]EAA2983584.1 hypothetical protein [Salmonella enterica subsp. diarizonae]EKR1419146.1 DUF968 domain-containing protein [Salmonella enterica subsp. diarizonae serovar 50:z:z52]WGI47877.1 DUF968 domain-containing protein [Salmonella enterica subsp. diarizonae serovar 48:i:z]HCM1650993.1 DUF968 domain-containing protein [Salmonella enterica subsp. diarizonae serovar 48:i:z35]EAQ6103120.1 DUF968 domain-containing protein [Salmonella enterica
MRAILTAFPQNGARITLLKSGNLTNRLRDGQRIMICDVPRQLENVLAGEIPDTGQWLTQDEALQPFFSDSRVINAAGGQEGLKTWVSRIPDCQCENGDHVRNLTTAQTKEGDAVRLCHACDNVHYMKGYRDLSEIIASNRAEWIVGYARMSLRLNADHQLTLPELFCWAVLRGVAEAMPVNVMRRFASLPEDEVLTGTIKEADINPWQLSARQLVEKKAGEGIAAMLPDIHTVSGVKNLIKDSGLNETATGRVKTVLVLVADGDPPAGYMRKPKMQRLELPEYTRWVKRQPCCGCGKQADDPHHIIGHGFSGTGTKACDLLVIPLCRVCHDALHADTRAWEEQNGSQLLWLARTLARATGIGAITAARAKE